ncbi:MAG: hypothetical protein K2Q26_06070 [Bdellovibrionales bacterium]|nr:hypothetical protein [Bdellovibrionales bacterium]
MLSTQKKIVFTALTLGVSLVAFIGVIEIYSQWRMKPPTLKKDPRLYQQVSAEERKTIEARYPFLQRRQSEKSYPEYHDLVPLQRSNFERSPQGILKPLPNVTERLDVTYAGSKQIQYSTVESTDGWSRRLSAPRDPASPPRAKHLLIMGCSFVWGDWLTDSDTLPWLLNEKQKTYFSYNLGGPGYSAADVLARIEFDGFFSEVQPRSGRAIYVFYKDHINRFVGNFRRLAKDHVTAYYEELSPYEFEFRGNQTSGKPVQTLIAKLLSSFKVIDFFDINYPIVGQGEMDQYARFLKVLEQKYQEEFGAKNPFTVLIYPDEYKSMDYAALVSTFKRHQLDVLDYNKFPLADYIEGDFLLPDSHPNRASHNLLADLLVTDLKLKDGEE